MISDYRRPTPWGACLYAIISSMNIRRNILIGLLILAALAVAGYAYSSRAKPAAGPAPTINTPAPANSASSTPQNASSSSALILDQSYNGKTFALRAGDRFLLKLGELNWNISFSDPSIVSRVKNIAVVRGGQGIYTADKPGTTVLSATGGPFCKPGEMCAQFLVSFRATIAVQ
jgi:hypothetical protein